MINKQILQGRLVRDPELTATNGGMAVCNFCVAWSETIGEYTNQLFLNCTTWSKTAEFVNKYFVKGQECVIEGQLRTQSYEKDGEKKSVIKCNVDKVHFCGKKTDGAPGGGTKQADELITVNDDDLPF